MKIVKLQKYRDVNDKNPIYKDVISHSKNPVTNESRSTNVHETAHMISSDIRNEYRGNNNGFYFENSRGVVIDHPNLTIRDVGPYVPKNLRGYRYQLYFVDQLKYWNKEPLYIMEEWNCYRLGGASAVEDHKQNINLERTDAVSGAFEFMIYSVCLYICIKDKDPDYYKNNEQFKEFFEYLLDESMTIYNKGKSIPEYNSEKSNKLFAEYQNSEEGKRIQKFVDDLIDFEVDYGFDYL